MIDAKLSAADRRALKEAEQFVRAAVINLNRAKSGLEAVAGTEAERTRVVNAAVGLMDLAIAISRK